MARIPEAEIERLKSEVSVERLAEARGIRLERHGADLIGLCPFHDDRNPSLVITPGKNLWGLRDRLWPPLTGYPMCSASHVERPVCQIEHWVTLPFSMKAVDKHGNPKEKAVRIQWLKRNVGGKGVN